MIRALILNLSMFIFYMQFIMLFILVGHFCMDRPVGLGLGGFGIENLAYSHLFKLKKENIKETNLKNITSLTRITIQNSYEEVIYPYQSSCLSDQQLYSDIEHTLTY